MRNLLRNVLALLAGIAIGGARQHGTHHSQPVAHSSACGCGCK